MLSILHSAYMHLALAATSLSAQVFDGPGLQGGVDEAGFIEGPVQLDLRDAILTILYAVLSFLALAAVIMIVVAGLYLVLSGGSDGAKDKAKKIILYVVIGLIIILLCRVLVGFLLYGIF